MFSDSKLSADTMTKPPIERFRASWEMHHADFSVIEVQGTIMKPTDSPTVLDTERTRLPTHHEKNQTYQPTLWNRKIPQVNPPEKLKPCNQDIRRARVKKYCAHYREEGVPIADIKNLMKTRRISLCLLMKSTKLCIV